MAVVENLTEAGAYKHMNATTLTADAIVSGPGVLLNVVINSRGATANTLTLYDSLTHGAGAVIAVIDTTSNVQVLNFNARLLVGLSAALATGTAADVTITAQAGAAY